MTPGAPMLKVDDLKKYYKVAANEIFGGAEAAHGEGQRDDQLRRARDRDGGDRRQIRLRQVDAGEGAARAGDGLVRHRHARQQGHPVDQHRGCATCETVSSIQMVFQNPFDTLNPSHSVGSQIIRTLEKFKVGKTVADRRQAHAGIARPRQASTRIRRAHAAPAFRRPEAAHRRRARAFAGNAKVVVADEPVSALDVSVQAGRHRALMDIQRKNKTTMLFISHDLSVVRYIADRVVVMYLGYIVEQGTTDQIFQPPYHPYTEALAVGDSDRGYLAW